MCGIVGIFHTKTRQQPQVQQLRDMRDAIAYRGPDQAGEYIKGPIALGIRRLSIIDLSGGTQPISSSDGRYTIVFNGEIYNYKQRRVALEKKYHFRTSSDTEVLLYHYIEFGPAGLLQLNGMFACAIWDSHTQELFLARDRFGKKPLYYHQTANGTFVFGSELKTILKYLAKTPALDRQALTRYLLFEYIPENDTPFTAIKKIAAGSWLKVSPQKIEQKTWWQFQPLPSEYKGNLTHPAHKLDQLLNQAVKSRMVADVPVGVLLSGGIDSTTIAWYMRQHTKQLHSFSIGFPEKSFNESNYATLAARSLGTDHHHITFTLDTFQEILATVLPKLDEPLSDASLLPTYAISQEAKKHVTVVLDGDGADELFYGYDTFPAYHASLLFEKLPETIQRLAERLTSNLPTRHSYFSLDFKLKSFVRGLQFPREVRNQVWIGSFHDQELKNLLSPSWQAYVPLLYEPISQFTSALKGHPPLKRLSLIYLAQYLQGDILTKIDRATMYASLEARTPFLDPALVSFVLQLPENQKYKFPRGKRLLRQVMDKRIPDQILHRKKQGFALPIGQWLRGPLRPLMQSTLSPAALESLGMVEPRAVAALMSEHISGRTDHRKKLWTLMVLHWWWERYGR